MSKESRSTTLASDTPARDDGIVGALEPRSIHDSPSVLSVFAAPEWDELSEDGRAWVTAIVNETALRASRSGEALGTEIRYVDWPCGEASSAGREASDAIDHEFKAHPDVFFQTRDGLKTFEFRKDDRGGYEVGQVIRLRCYLPLTQSYTDDPPIDRVITNILRPGEFGLQDGYCILSLAALRTHKRESNGERVRHVKRGTEYEVIGEAEAQVSEGMRRYGVLGATRLLSDGEMVVVYRCLKTGKLWCRFPDEMADGRFVPIASSPAPQDREGGKS